MPQGTGRERGPAGRPALTRRSRAVWGPALPSRYPGPAAEPPCGADVLGRGHEQSSWPQQAAGPWPPPCPALLLRVGLAGPWAARLAYSAAPGLHSVQDVASGLTGCAVATQGPHFTPEPWLWSRRCMGPRHTWGPGHRWAGCEEDRGAPGRHCSGPHRAAARTGPAPRPMRASGSSRRCGPWRCRGALPHVTCHHARLHTARVTRVLASTRRDCGLTALESGLALAA